MEGDSIEKEDSFEILPHLSEYDAFMDVQKYRYINKYGNDFTAETNSISTSNVWNISEIEFYDMTNPLTTDEGADKILIPCPIYTSGDKIPTTNNKLESELNFRTPEYSLYNSANEYPVSNIIQINDDSIEFESERKIEDDFHFNDTKSVIEIVSDDTLSTKSNNGIVTSQNAITFNVRGNIMELKGSTPDFESRSESARETCTETPKNNTSVKVYRGRSKSSKRICQAVDKSLKFCKWLQRNRIVRTVLQGAKSSLSCFVNLFEVDFNSLIDFDERKLNLIIVADRTQPEVIEDAFFTIFGGFVSVSSVDPAGDSGPVLPIGHNAGVQKAEMQIGMARRNDCNTAMVSTSTLLHEAVPQRWQMTTVICLDDPKLQLKMHNFTLSTPVPNEYVTEALKWTPSQISENSGLAISIEQAISNLSPEAVKDAQQFLTGCDSHASLKSAALVLAGMYKKYLVPPLLNTF